MIERGVWGSGERGVCVCVGKLGKGEEAGYGVKGRGDRGEYGL